MKVDIFEMIGWLYSELVSAASTQQEELDAETVLSAQNFFFDPRSIEWDLFNQAADYGHQLAKFNALRLPFERCVFQFGPTDGRMAWIIASDHAGELKFGAYVLDVEKERLVMFPRLRIEADEQETLKFSGPCSKDRQEFLHSFAFGALGLIATRGIVDNEKLAPRRLNEKRAARGEVPIFGYHLLTIDPNQVRLPGRAGLGGAHAAPRLHWRRGHVRRLPSGAVTTVRPCLVGDVRRGFLEKDHRVGSDEKAMRYER